LDAKFFLTQIIRLSFKTLNQMEENAARYAIIDEKDKKDAAGGGGAA
jgi:hypothetical protein